MADTSLVKADSREVELAGESTSLLDIIRQVVGSGPIDSAKMDVLERMMAMQVQIEERNEKRAFFDAKARVQAKMPQIHRESRSKHNTYAKYEAIDKVARPIISEEGFSESISESGAPDESGKSLFVYTVSRGAHSESISRRFSTDTAAKNSSGVAIRSALQDEGATTSFAKRYLRCMFFNIVTTDEDTDGESLENISRDQAHDLEVMIADAGGTPDGAERVRKRLLNLMECDSVAGILAKNFDVAKSAMREAMKAKREREAQGK